MRYEELLAEAGKLGPAEQLRLLRDIAALLRAGLPDTPAQDAPKREGTSGPLRSVLELDGLGAELWRGVDSGEYLRRERESWGG